MPRKKVLITGITGGFGSLLHEKLNNEFDVYGTTTRVKYLTDRNFYLNYLFPDFEKERKIYEEEWDAVILNAAIAIIGNAEEFTHSEMLKIFIVNVLGPWKMLKRMRKNKKKIVVMSSKCVTRKRKGLRVYGNTKKFLEEVVHDMGNEDVLILRPDAMKTNMKIIFCENQKIPCWRPSKKHWEDPQRYIQEIYDFLL